MLTIVPSMILSNLKPLSLYFSMLCCILGCIESLINSFVYWFTLGHTCFNILLTHSTRSTSGKNTFKIHVCHNYINSLGNNIWFTHAGNSFILAKTTSFSFANAAALCKSLLNCFSFLCWSLITININGAINQATDKLK